MKFSFRGRQSDLPYLPDLPAIFGRALFTLEMIVINMVLF